MSTVVHSRYSYNMTSYLGACSSINTNGVTAVVRALNTASAWPQSWRRNGLNTVALYGHQGASIGD